MWVGMSVGKRIRQTLVVALGGLMYALFYAFGSEVERYGTCAMPATLLKAIAISPVFMLALVLLLRAEREVAGKGNRSFSAKKAFIFILICYLPMYVIMFPGTFRSDTANQLEQIIMGMYNTHHPLLHTLLFKLCIESVALTGSLNRAFALYSALQTVLLAGCFALTCASIARTCNGKAARLSAVFFALYPMHMIFAGTMTKDVLFAGVFAWMMAVSAEMLTVRTPTKRLYGQLVSAGILAVLLRNNMRYAVAAWLVIGFFFLCKTHARLLLCVLLSLVLALGANAGLVKLTDAQPGDVREMLTWPVQQVIRACLTMPERIDAQELESVDRVIPMRKWKDYNPRISDPIKGALDSAEMKRNLPVYLSAYLSIGMKCPQAYLDAVVEQAYPYFYPYSRYPNAYDYIEAGLFEDVIARAYGEGRIVQLERFEAIRTWLYEHVWSTGADRIPVLGWILNAGWIAWAMLFYVLREAYAGRWARFAVFLLPVLLWGTYLMGPVMYARYIYPFVCALPVLASREREG